VSFSLPGEPDEFSHAETAIALEENPELKRDEFRPARLIYFRDIIGALVEWKARHEKTIREEFYLTATGKTIWETLDYARATNGMVVVDGEEGRGKSEAAKAWCKLHLGSARFVSLKGITNKTTVFREIAKALGIASSYTRTATEMQPRIEDVLKRSRLLIVLDEAHFLFNQSQRMYSRPELIDWIDTALCNCGIGCALVTTPQFLVCMTRAADQVEWNYRQFRRRVRRWVKLPDKNSEDDIKGVVRSVFKNASESTIKKVLGYALASKRDVSAVGDVVAEIRAMTGADDLKKASVHQVMKAINDFLLPSDKTFLEGMEKARSAGRRTGRKSRQNVFAPKIQASDDPEIEEELPQGERRPPVDIQPADFNRSKKPELSN
jgi:DNA transposition AAA+ family ATPase